MSLLGAQTQAEKIQSLLQAAHERGIFNGSALVARDGQILYQTTLGTADGKGEIPLTADHRFSIGSIAKEFNAVGIMLLRETGKLQLTDPVGKYLVDLPAWADSVQIRHLLNYTSGLPNIRYGEVRNNEDVLQDLMELPRLEAPPGTVYRYNNNNVFLQKRIIEKITGTSYETFLQSNILSPCGMDQAVFDPIATTPQIARSFDNEGMEDPLDNITAGWPAVSIRDLYRWTQGLHQHRIIAREALVELFDYFEDHDASLGEGRLLDQNVTFHRHHGSSYNYEALLQLDLAEGITILLLTNNKNFQLFALAEAIDRILHDRPYEVPKKSLSLALRTRILRKGFAAGLQLLEDIRANQADTYELAELEGDLNDVGYYLLRRDHLADAIEVFRLNVRLHPESSNAYDSLGEVYLEKRDKTGALENYQKALRLDAGNERIEKTINRIKSEM